jgi:hypothetical protein
VHRRTALVAVCAVVAAIVAAAAMVTFEVPEGMPWSFRARDGDPGLTRAARRMQPIAVAVDAFLAARGRCPTWRNRDDIDGVLAFVPAEMRAAAMTGVGGPMFSTSPRTLEECRVVIRLSHDELLVRDSDGQAVRWSYDRGDGTDPVPLRLSP